MNNFENKQYQYLPAIVVIGYNRPHSLKRLLDSLSDAKIPKNTKLLISLDYCKDKASFVIANEFFWKFGDKDIIFQNKNLGLKKHVLKCGDLTDKYGSIIMLEDDLFVSENFYEFATQALNYYSMDKKIGGISLYTHLYNVHSKTFFRALDDDSDVFFFQFASSWGQAWTRTQWKGFRKWFKENDLKITKDDLLPENVLNWPETSWLKYFIKYLVEEKKFFVYPKTSLSTNFADIGTHHNSTNEYIYQVPLQIKKASKYKLINIVDSYSVYDSFFELLPEKLKLLTDDFLNYDFEIDLYGVKKVSKIKKEYVLTSKKCKEYLLAFDRSLKPMELNVINKFKGSKLFFVKKENIIEDEGEIVKDKIDRLSYFTNRKIFTKEIFLLLKHKILKKMKLLN